MSKDENATYRFAPSDEPGDMNHADNPTMALMAVCVASQQKAGFRDYIDLRVLQCPDCGGDGFNTGWGYWSFACGAEVLSDGEPSEPCGLSGGVGRDPRPSLIASQVPGTNPVFGGP